MNFIYLQVGAIRINHTYDRVASHLSVSQHVLHILHITTPPPYVCSLYPPHTSHYLA